MFESDYLLFCRKAVPSGTAFFRVTPNSIFGVLLVFRASVCA